MKLQDKGFSAVEGLIILVVVALISGAGYYVYNKQSTKNSVETPISTGQASTLPSDLDAVLPIEKVEELVSASNGSVTITGVELEMKNGTLVYIVKLSDGTKVAFNATTGAKVAVSDDNDEPEEHDYPSSMSTKVSLSSAVAIAQAEHPGVAVKKIEIEVEDGVLVYSIRFVDEARVDVEANNGSIIEIHEKDGKEVKGRHEKRNDDDHDDDGESNREDRDDDNDKKDDNEDDDDDNDDVKDDEDHDDDNDDVDDQDDEDHGDDNSGSDGQNEPEED